MIMDLIANPSLVVKANLSKIHSSYRGPLRHGLSALQKGMLIIKEPIKHESAYRCLQIVPCDLRNIVFIAFHANPIGGHLGLNKTIIRIRLRFFWPGLYSYCKKMISSCVGCQMANATRSPAKELVYNFPIDTLMSVLHLDG